MVSTAEGDILGLHALANDLGPGRPPARKPAERRVDSGRRHVATLRSPRAGEVRDRAGLQGKIRSIAFQKSTPSAQVVFRAAAVPAAYPLDQAH